MNIGFLRANRNMNKADRPVINIEMTPADWLLEGVALAGILVMAVVMVYHYPKLPAVIPSHFDGAGMPDDYSAKSSVWALPGITLFLYILLTLIMKIPHQFNYSVKITKENAAIQYAMAMKLIRYLKAGLVWMFFYIAYTTVRVAEKKSTGLGAGFLPIVLVCMILPVFVYLFLAARKR
ncbi:MAG TPA: DUF1648 domain-containing protein [Bacteroidales bacterium]|nr:DUF1648 domain-containing protein [Bacteroidales bacterium]